MQHLSYSINHQSFTKEQLIDHANHCVTDSAMPVWERDIWYFILEWLNEKDFVTLKTSGSTGEPKLIKVAKQYMRNSAQMTFSFLGLQPGNTSLLCLPAAYIAGKMMIVRALEGKMNLLYAEPSANPLENINENIDFAAMIPLQVENIIMQNSLSKLSTIENLIIGGAAVNKELAELLTMLKTQVWSTYGMTETVSHVALKKLSGDDASDYFSPLPKVRLFVDERDCLAIDAPHLAEAEVHTNDIVSFNENGQFRFIGRYDNVINTGGVKVVPEQLEAKIKDLIDTEFIITSQPDDRLGQRIILKVETSSETKYDEVKLLKRLRTRLSGIECPKQVLFVREFERTQTGKVKR